MSLFSLHERASPYKKLNGYPNTNTQLTFLLQKFKVIFLCPQYYNNDLDFNYIYRFCNVQHTHHQGLSLELFIK